MYWLYMYCGSWLDITICLCVCVCILCWFVFHLKFFKKYIFINTLVTKKTPTNHSSVLKNREIWGKKRSVSHSITPRVKWGSDNQILFCFLLHAKHRKWAWYLWTALSFVTLTFNLYGVLLIILDKWIMYKCAVHSNTTGNDNTPPIYLLSQVATQWQLTED